VGDVRHEIVAVGSRSLERAQQFLDELSTQSTAKAYGSYEELVADPAVDIVYIASPHSHHFLNAYLCLQAGKHVLCEKPFTVNAEQTRVLIQLARKKRLFLMEAVWTRFFPLSIQVRELIKAGRIGTVYRVYADFSFGYDIDSTWAPTHRMINMDLAGGCLLDSK
jgi:predicted dehydrogenase